MFRLATLAFGLLFSLMFLGCGGSAPGTSAGGDNGTGGGNTIGMVELPISVGCYQTRMNVEENCRSPLMRATGQRLPIFEWKFEARSCDTNTLLHHANTSDFLVFWDSFKVQFPKQGCVDVINTITLPLPGKPSATWFGTKRIEDTATLDPHNPPSFTLLTDGDW